TVQEVQTLLETMVNRLEAIENLKTDTTGAKAQTKENKKDLTLPVPFRVRDDLPKIISSSPAMVNPVTNTQKQANDEHPEDIQNAN
ncbi:hypothetical protein ACQP3D_29340, partial [Escherichia coli]